MNKENSAPARLLPTPEENPNPPVLSQGSPSVWEHEFFGEYGRVANMGPHDVADEDVECAAYVTDNTKGTHVAMQSHIVTAGASTAKLVVRFSDYDTIDWGDFAEIPLSTANAVKPRVTLPVLLPNEAKLKKLLLKLVRRGGNGVLTPEMWNALVSVTSARTPNTPGGNDDPLTEDATWGDIVFDINAHSSDMLATYAEDEDVPSWIDQIGAAHNMETTATLLLPKYKPTGIGGILPCLEWGGNTVPLTNPGNPTQPYGSYTYYIVAANLDGGDSARLWGAGLGDSFQYSYYFNDTQVYAANNNLFGSPSIFATDDWGMLDIHIYRFTKNSGAASHQIWVDGILKGSAGAAPQTNNGGTSYLMDSLGGLGFSGKICRVVAYNKNHQSPTGTGGAVNGLTAPELILRSFWGTP